MLKMKDLPTSERPYEKLEIYGAKKLSNSELLAIILKTGTKDENAVSIAQKILNLNKEKNINNLRFLTDISIEEICKIKGIGKVKAIQIIACGEIAKRIMMPIDVQNIKIRNSQDVADLLMEELKYEKREIAKVILLNSKNIIQKIIDISIGGTNFAMLEPKDVLYEAVKADLPKIIIVHNHPSRRSNSERRRYKTNQEINICCRNNRAICTGPYNNCRKTEVKVLLIICK